MDSINELFKPELIFESNAKTKKEVINDVGKYLIENNYVKDEFIRENIKREKNYPTGLDLTPVSTDINSVAIPHTETKFCLTNAIALVRLNNTLNFCNMINPQQEIEVKYLFIIINDKKDEQTNVLSS